MANNLTTKIQSTSSDFLGKWIKLRLFAKKGAVVVYTVYRPNPTTLATAGVNSSWILQYRHLSKKDPKVNPRNKLINDLIDEIQTEQKIHSEIIVVGDFNEDIHDNCEEGIKKLMAATELVQPFQALKHKIPSTRGNNRAIDHFFLSPQLQQYVNRAGMVPEEVSFASDHMGLFLDLSPKILDTKNAPIPPASHRKLKMHNTPNVRKYVENVLKQMKCHSITHRLEKLDATIKEDEFDEVSAFTLEKIDVQMRDIMLKAEDDLAPSDTKYAFSEDLLLQMRKVRLIKTFIRQYEKNYPLESFVDATIEEEALDLVTRSKPELEHLLISERQLLCTMQDESWDIREGHNTRRMEAAAEDEHKDVAVKIKEMREREKQGRMFERIGNVLKVKNFGTITRLGHLEVYSLEDAGRA